MTGVGMANAMKECSKDPQCGRYMRDYPGIIAFTITAIPFSIIMFFGWLNGEFRRKP